LKDLDWTTCWPIQIFTCQDLPHTDVIREALKAKAEDQAAGEEERANARQMLAALFDE
jgi:hypothetical protein